MVSYEQVIKLAHNNNVDGHYKNTGTSSENEGKLLLKTYTDPNMIHTCETRTCASSSSSIKHKITLMCTEVK